MTVTTAAVRRHLPLAGLAALVLVVAVLVARPAGDGPPLAPTSTAPDGTKALVDVLAGLGAAVDVVDAVPTGAHTALLLVDRLADPAREQLRRWVRGGGTLVVTDPRSPLAPEVTGSTGAGPVDPTVARNCDLPALASVGRVTAAGSATYEVPAGAVGCFGRGDARWLVARPEGGGAVVAVGGPRFLTNGSLGAADNAVLAAALLAPRPDTRVAILRPALPGTGAASLSDLVPARLKAAGWQLAIAFCLLALWRARRLGQPVTETPPVLVGGSELVVAVGNLLQRTGARDRAAALLRRDLRRDLAARLGVPDDLDDAALADVVAARTPAKPAAVLAVLAGPPPASDAALVELAQQVEQVRRAAFAGPAVDPQPASPRAS